MALRAATVRIGRVYTTGLDAMAGIATYAGVCGYFDDFFLESGFFQVCEIKCRATEIKHPIHWRFR